MKNLSLKKFLLSVITLSSATAGLTQAQDTLNTSQLLGGINTITTAVPFLLICPDSRAGGMGEVGVSTSPDVNSTHWNLANLPFLTKLEALGFHILHGYASWFRILILLMLQVIKN